MTGPGPGEGAKITGDVLRIGFTKMKSQDREMWLNNIKNKDFTLQRLELGTAVGIGDVVSLSPKEFEMALVTTPKDLHTIWGMKQNTLKDVDTTSAGTSAVGDHELGGAGDTTQSKDKRKEIKSKRKRKKMTLKILKILEVWWIIVIRCLMLVVI